MDSTYSPDNRIKWIDMLKGVAMLAVMVGHLMQHTYIGDFAYSFSVPLFIFASGYLFKRYGSFKEFLLHKFKSLIIPYIMFGLPFPIVIAYYNAGMSSGSFNFSVSFSEYFSALLKELCNYILQIHYNVIWYLAMIFLANVIMYFILKLRHRWIQTVIILLLMTIGYLYYYFGGTPLVWNIDTTLMALPFFYMGHIFSSEERVMSKISDMKKSRAVILIISFLVGNVIFNLLTIHISGECLDMNLCEYGFLPFTYLSAIFGIFAFLIFSVRFQSRFVEFMGRHSLIYFVMHVAIIHAINFSISSIFHIPSLADVVGSGNYNIMDYPLMLGYTVIYLVIIAFVVWLVILLFSHTPLKRYF